MKGDFSSIREPRLSERLVLKQQGRVDLDADDNLAFRTFDALLQNGLTEAIGPAGVPKWDPGFRILSADGQITIGHGRMFVDGLLCTLDADTPYESQPDYPNPPSLSDISSPYWLLYLDVWERHVAAVSDPTLLEPALSGLDTTNRVRTVWQVRVVGATSPIDPAAAHALLPPALGGGSLTLTLSPATVSTDPCGPMSAGGFAGLENRLYRIEVHHPGDRPGTSALEGATPHAAIITARAETTATVRVTGGTAKGPWLVGQPVEIEQSGLARRGTATISAVTCSGSEADLSLADVADLPAVAEVSVYRIATFKWSRDNGSIAYGVTAYRPAGAGSATLTLAAFGKDEASSLHEGDVVELVDRDRELRGEPGVLGRVATGGISRAERAVTIEGDFRGPPAIAGLSGGERPRLVRWDQRESSTLFMAAERTPMALELGLSVTLGGNGFATGDYWTFALRPAEHGLSPGQPARVLLSDAPAAGILHHLAPLAIAAGEGGSVTDLRRPFPPLTAIHARDVTFSSEGDCSLPSTTVQAALLALCNATNLTFHNQQLHGWGVVNGLQVHCLKCDEVPEAPAGSAHAPKAAECVAVEAGYAITAGGRDVRVQRRFLADLRALLLQAGLINVSAEDAIPDTEARMYLEKDGTVALEAYVPPKKWEFLDGTIWEDFFDDCVFSVLDFLKKELTETSSELVSPAQKRLAALLNLFVQVFDKNAQHVFLSGLEHPSTSPRSDAPHPDPDDREDTLLRGLFVGLSRELRSQTFCAMLDDIVYPACDYINEADASNFGRPETIFIKGFHGKRIRTNRAGTRFYTIGNGDTINEVTLADRKMTAELVFPVAGAAIQDIAFGPSDLVMYVVALIGDYRQKTAFAVATLGLDGRYTFQSPVSTICDLQIVTLAAPTALAETPTPEILGVAKGKGLYKIKVAAPELPTPVAEAYAIGHLFLDERASRQEAYFTRSTKSETSVFDGVVRVRYMSGNMSSFSVPPGTDDMAFSPDADAVLTVTNGWGDSPNRTLFVLSVTGKETKYFDMGITSDVRLVHKPGTGLVFFTSEDEHEVRIVEVRRDRTSAPGGGEQPFTGGLLPEQHPVQLGPIAITMSPNGQTLGVLNFASKTVTVTPARRQSVIDRERLALYRVRAINAFVGLAGRLLQYLKDCFCERLLLDPPSDSGQKIYLASVRVRDGSVYRICNFDRRRYVHSFPGVEYWMSLVPILPLVRIAVTKFCCAVLPPSFERLRLAEPAPPEPEAPASENLDDSGSFLRSAPGETSFFSGLKVSTARKSYDHVYATNPKRKVVSGYSSLLGIGANAKKLTDEALAEPPVIDSTSISRAKPQEALAGLSQGEAAIRAKESGWNIDRVRPLSERSEPALTEKLFGPKSLARGGAVDVFVDEKGVVQFAEPVPTSETAVRRLDAELQASKLETLRTERATSEIAPVGESVQSLKEDLSVLTKRFEEESARSTTLATEVERLRSKEAAQEQTLSGLRARLAEVESANSTLKTLAAELQKLKSDVSVLDTTLSTIKNR